MKYFTKEWFRIMQDPFGDVLVETPRAAAFSEEYFQELFQARFEALRKVAYYAAACDEYRRRFEIPRARTLEEVRIMSDAVAEWADSLEEQERGFFDDTNIRKKLEWSVQGERERWENVLPKEILARVADVRVLAMGVAAPELVEKIKRFLSARKEWVIDCLHTVQENDREILARHPDFPMHEINCHDEKLRNLSWEGGDLLLHMGHFAHDRECEIIRFKNCRVLRMEGPLDGARWLYEEVYEADGGYEIHVLLDTSGTESMNYEKHLREMIVRTENVEVIS